MYSSSLWGDDLLSYITKNWCSWQNFQTPTTSTYLLTWVYTQSAFSPTDRPPMHLPNAHLCTWSRALCIGNDTMLRILPFYHIRKFPCSIGPFHYHSNMVLVLPSLKIPLLDPCIIPTKAPFLYHLYNNCFEEFSPFTVANISPSIPHEPTPSAFYSSTTTTSSDLQIATSNGQISVLIHSTSDSQTTSPLPQKPSPHSIP